MKGYEIWLHCPDGDKWERIQTNVKGGKRAAMNLAKAYAKECDKGERVALVQKTVIATYNAPTDAPKGKYK